MPFISRQVNSHHKSLPRDLRQREDLQELLCQSVLLQLGDLARKSDDIFNILGEECIELRKRTESLLNRVVVVRKMTEKVANLQGGEVTPAVQTASVPARKHDEMLFRPDDRPHALQVQYLEADSLPNFSLMRQFMENEIDNKKFYSDPNYFFQTWKETFLEKTKKENEELQARRKRKRMGRDKNAERKVFSFVPRLKTQREKIIEREIQKGTLILQQHMSPVQVASDVISTVEPTLSPSQLSPISLENLPELTAEDNLSGVGDLDTEEKPFEEEVCSSAAFYVPPTDMASVPPPPPLPPPAPLMCGAPPVPPPVVIPSPARPSPAPPPAHQQLPVRTSMAAPLDLLTQIQMGKQLRKVERADKEGRAKRLSGMAGVFQMALEERRNVIESDGESDNYNSDSDSDWD